MHLSGADVRIATDGRVWVLVPAGILGRSARWKQVDLGRLSFDADYPDELISPYARHSIKDLGISTIALSHELGLPRRDPRRSAEIWSEGRSIRGSQLAVDLESRELASADHPFMIWPFSAFVRVETNGAPRLISKAASDFPLGDYPLDPSALAAAMGLPISPSKPA